MGSQPAIDGAISTDEVVGWGPKGGYVYQKGFVEFFAPEEDVERIVQKIDAEGKGWVDYFAVNLEVRSAFLTFRLLELTLFRAIYKRMYRMTAGMLLRGVCFLDTRLSRQLSSNGNLFCLGRYVLAWSFRSQSGLLSSGGGVLDMG